MNTPQGNAQPIATVPLDGTKVRVWNAFTGWYETIPTNGLFPYHDWGYPGGVWYPQPSVWEPMPSQEPANAEVGPASDTSPPAEPESKRDSRELACRLAAQVCQGQTPSGTTLLSYIILFENYLDLGSDETATMMGWDVVEKPPVSLQVVRDAMKETLS